MIKALLMSNCKGSWIRLILSWTAYWHDRCVLLHFTHRKCWVTSKCSAERSLAFKLLEEHWRYSIGTLSFQLNFPPKLMIVLARLSIKAGLEIIVPFGGRNSSEVGLESQAASRLHIVKTPQKAPLNLERKFYTNSVAFIFGKRLHKELRNRNKSTEMFKVTC